MVERMPGDQEFVRSNPSGFIFSFIFLSLSESQSPITVFSNWSFEDLNSPGVQIGATTRQYNNAITFGNPMTSQSWI